MTDLASFPARGLRGPAQPSAPASQRVLPVKAVSQHIWLIWALYISLLIPIYFNLGQFTIPAYRIPATVMMVPAMLLWVTGKLGQRSIMDLLILVFCLWMSVALAYNHPLSRVYENIGFTIIETAGAYFIGRMAVRNARGFMVFVKLHFLSLVILLPFAMIETQTGDPMIIDMIMPFFQTHPVITYETRLGLERAQVVFQHPIVYGVYAAAAFGTIVYSLSFVSSGFTTFFRAAVVIVSTICSVSSGAVMALMAQFTFTAYDVALRKISRRWTIFVVMAIIMYVTIDTLSNRTPFHVLISYLTLNSSTGYNRIRIFEFGMDSVMRYPVFGLGFRDWVRERWMSSSVDNFWLLLAMRYGIPGFLTLAGMVGILVFRLTHAKIDDPLSRAMRRGVLVSLGGIILSASTVHLWGPIYVWFMFYLGAVMWLLDPQATAAPPDTKQAPTPQTKVAVPDVSGVVLTPYSRFAIRKGRNTPTRR